MYRFKCMRLLYLILFVFISTLPVYSFAFKPVVKKYTLTTPDHYKVELIRYVRENPNARRKLILHGIGNNSMTWKAAARELWQQGFDVWIMNFRMHGDPEMMKKIMEENNKEMKRHLYLEVMASYDLPMVIDFILTSCYGVKPEIIAHSMGGMIANLFFAGIFPKYISSDPSALSFESIEDRMKKGELFDFNPRQAEINQAKVRSITYINVPHSLKDVQGLLKRLSERSILHKILFTSGIINSHHKLNILLNALKKKGWAGKQAVKAAEAIIGRIAKLNLSVIRMFYVPRNLTVREAAFFFRYGLSPFYWDLLIEEFVSLTKKDKLYIRRGTPLDYSTIKVPMQVIGCAQDEIIPDENTQRIHDESGTPDHLKNFLLLDKSEQLPEGVGHDDPAAAAAVYEVMFKKIEKEQRRLKSLLPPNEPNAHHAPPCKKMRDSTMRAIIDNIGELM